MPEAQNASSGFALRTYRDPDFDQGTYPCKSDHTEGLGRSVFGIVSSGSGLFQKTFGIMQRKRCIEVQRNSYGYHLVTDPQSNIITEAVVVRTLPPPQLTTDHLPGTGLPIAPDGDPNNINFSYSSWDTGSGTGAAS
jgi:hypothetical protein